MLLHTEALTTQVMHEQIKYCLIEIFFFIHTARVNYGNSKMCINRSEDRILRYSVATVSRYVIGGCTYELKKNKQKRKGNKSKHTCALSRERDLGLSQEHLDLEKAVLWFCSYCAAAWSQEKQTALTCYIHLVD